MRQVLAALRLEHIGMVGCCSAGRFHAAHAARARWRIGLRRWANGNQIRSRSPKPEWQSSARLNGRPSSSRSTSSHRAVLSLCMASPCGAAVPGQPGADALAAHQKGHAAPAHPPARCASGPRPCGLARVPRSMPPGIDDGHEHQAHPLQQRMQRRVPWQPHDQAVQPGDDDVGADALEPVHAAEEAQRPPARRDCRAPRYRRATSSPAPSSRAATRTSTSLPSSPMTRSSSPSSGTACVSAPSIHAAASAAGKRIRPGRAARRRQAQASGSGGRGYSSPSSSRIHISKR